MKKVFWFALVFGLGLFLAGQNGFAQQKKAMLSDGEMDAVVAGITGTVTTCGDATNPCINVGNNNGSNGGNGNANAPDGKDGKHGGTADALAASASGTIGKCFTNCVPLGGGVSTAASASAAGGNGGNGFSPPTPTTLVPVVSSSKGKGGSGGICNGKPC